MHFSTKQSLPTRYAYGRYGGVLEVDVGGASRTSTRMTLHNRLTLDVLLVEDNPGDARLIREMLNEAQDAEWRLIHVDRLDSAIELLASKRFDVCLLDLNLPDSQAQQTLNQLYAFFSCRFSS